MKKITYLLFTIGLFVYSFIRLFLPALADQSINITASVLPTGGNYQNSISEDFPGLVSQNSVITYTITYGSTLLYANQLTIEASWPKGAIPGNNVSIEGLNYVTGSASQAYNNTTPVVDLTNNKIDWTISSFPANTTNQTVTFQLVTNSLYTGSSKVTYPVSVKLITSNLVTTPVSVTTTYQYNPPITPTPTPTAIPPLTPTPTPTPIPPQLKPAVFPEINLFNLTSNEADIEFIVNQTGTTNIFYGTSPLNLTSVQTTTGTSIFTLSNLNPQTSYYFQLVSYGPDGQFTSEIFSFTTPKTSLIPQILTDSLIITAPNDVLYNPSLNNFGGFVNTATKTPIINISPNTDYAIVFKLTKTQDIKLVEILLQNTVLGISSKAHAQTPSTYVFSAFDKGGGIYSANILNTLPSGNYIGYIKIADTTGNITTQKIANFHILHPFRVYDGDTKNPIEDVRITLYEFDPQSNSYVKLPFPQYTNPLYTNKFGEATEQLPSGKYKVTFSNMLIGYNAVTKYFSLGNSQKDDYPTVYLHLYKVSLMNIADYYKSAFLDWLSLTNSYVNNLRASYRFFNLTGIVVLICLVLLTLFIFKVKTKIALSRIHNYFHHHFLKSINKNTPYAQGKIIDESSTAISGATIIVTDSDKHVLFQTESNSKGSFLIPKNLAKETVTVIKNGYIEKSGKRTEDDLLLSLKKNSDIKYSILKRIIHILEKIAGTLFAFLLMFSLILEALLAPEFGLLKTAPFILISLFNLCMWVFYLRE